MPPRAKDEDEEGRVEDVDDEDEEQEEQEEEEEEEEEAVEETASPWAGLKTLPEREDITSLIEELKEAGKKQLTILLLGKSSVGKSSLVNSILNEQLAKVIAFKLQAETELVTPYLKQVEDPDSGADGFRVKLIDTCGLEDPEAGDTVNYAALKKIAKDIKGKEIDVVLYVDRLDLYRVEPLDQAILGAVSKVLGRGIWRRTVLVLTHGNMTQAPPGSDYDSFATRRIRCLRKAIPAGRVPFLRPSLPATLVENSDLCPKDATGRRMLPDSSLWLVELLATVVDVAAKGRPYVYRPHMTQSPNNSFKWLVPLVAAGQYYLWIKYLKPQLDTEYNQLKTSDERVWSVKADHRRKLGIGPPLKPSEKNTWRLEQMYEE